MLKVTPTLRILLVLKDLKGGATVEELAAKYSVSENTIRRDFKTIAAAEYKITRTVSEPYRYYVSGDG